MEMPKWGGWGILFCAQPRWRLCMLAEFRLAGKGRGVI